MLVSKYLINLYVVWTVYKTTSVNCCRWKKHTLKLIQSGSGAAKTGESHQQVQAEESWVQLTREWRGERYLLCPLLLTSHHPTMLLKWKFLRKPLRYFIAFYLLLTTIIFWLNLSLTLSMFYIIICCRGNVCEDAE